MGAARTLASLARAAREEANVRVRQPLRHLKVAMPATIDQALFREVLDLLQAEVNVKDIELAHAETDLVRLRGKANFRTLGKAYGKETPAAAAAVAQLRTEQLLELERGAGVTLPLPSGETFAYRPEDVVVEREVATGLSGWVVKSEGQYVAALDPVVTPELEQEGIAREVISRVQRLRKEAGLEYTDRIELSVKGDPAVVAAVAAARPLIFRETLARDVFLDRDLPAADLREAVEIDGRPADIALRRVPAPAPGPADGTGRGRRNDGNSGPRPAGGSSRAPGSSGTKKTKKNKKKKPKQANAGKKQRTNRGPAKARKTPGTKTPRKRV
jgi:isoleucyl-tRNA synthetase